MATTYETLYEETHRFGKNGYLEIARKRVADGPGEAAEFLLITRGFVDGSGVKRWTRFVTVPADADTRAWLAAALARSAP